MDSLALFLGVFFFLLAVGVPVGFSLGSTMAFLVVFKSSLPLMIVSQQMIIGADNFTLIAIPFFILAAELMGCGGIANRLIDFVNSVVGWIRGGLGLVNVGTNMVLAGLSGSSVADAALTSSFFIPTMVRRGYGPAFSAALTAAASVMGIIIPPSIPMILLGLITGQSVLSLFLGGVVPGVMIGLSLMGVTYRLAKKRGYPAESRVPVREVWRRFRATLWATLYPVVIIGGILGGVFTLTEASVVAVVYALVVGRLVYRELTLKGLYTSMVNAAVTASLIMFIAATASGVAWFLNSERVPQTIAAFLTHLTRAPLIFMMIVNVFLLIVGCVMDLVPALLILAPILYPISQQYSINPIYFGVVMVTNLAIGLITPPVGNCLYIATAVAKVPVTQVIKEIWQFLIALIVVLFLITLFPFLITWLPTALRT
jgi:tripartite ATP-independent transporter DctM subunit